MGPGVPAKNIFQWDGFRQGHAQWTDAVIPDPGSGSLYNSTVPMQDTQHIYASWAAAPVAAPWVPTIATQLGMPNFDTTNDWAPPSGDTQPDWWAGAPPAVNLGY